MKTIYLVYVIAIDVLGEDYRVPVHELISESSGQFRQGRATPFNTLREATDEARTIAEHFLGGRRGKIHLSIDGRYVSVERVIVYKVPETDSGEWRLEEKERVASEFVGAHLMGWQSYAKAYEALTAYLGEYFRLRGHDLEDIQIDGIASLESSHQNGELRHLMTEVRYTLADGSKRSVTAHQSSYNGWFPIFSLGTDQEED